MKVYGISGLGADGRVFSILNQYLRTPIIHIPWIKPVEKETLEEYSIRLTKEIVPSENMVLIGVSLGGMVAVEISKHLKFGKVIIISSVGEAGELPKTVTGLVMAKLLGLIPTHLIIPPVFLISWFFGVKNKNNKQLLSEIIADTDRGFAKWAINQIPRWNNKILPSNLIRIHGDNDKVLPAKSGILYHQIKNAGHFAIIENTEEIAKIINSEVGQL
jgi:pimeloyl-ACP methyl ester carboxylesterase